jgi:hypothetical protein
MDRCNRPGNVCEESAGKNTQKKTIKDHVPGVCVQTQMLDEDLQSAKLSTLDVGLSFLAVIDSSKTSTGMCAK